MIIKLGEDESMIIIRGNGNYQAVIPKGGPEERLSTTAELAYMLVYALSDEECITTIKRRWNERLDQTRRPN